MSSSGDGLPISVVVADDYPLYVEALRRRLDDDARFTWAGTVSDGPSAVEACARARPDVALVGYFLAARRGVDVLHGVMEASPATRVVVLAGVVDPDVVHSAVAVGAHGFLVKQESGEAVLEALHRVGCGGTAFSPAAEQCLLEAVRARAEDSDAVPSPRENEILRHLVDGATSKEMAARLYLSEATVKSHLNRLYRKLGVNDRSAAVAEAMRRDWVS